MNQQDKSRIVLFQPYLRKHILNFGKFLQQSEFIIQQPSNGNFYQTHLPSSFDREINRMKTSFKNNLRRIFGICNVRIKFDRTADSFFTYGSFLITNKPYCIYIENGVAPYNYDVEMAHNPIAKLVASFLIRRKSCTALIFMSKAAQKSFTASVRYSKKTLVCIQQKSVQIYPLVEAKNVPPKKETSTLRLLFAGMFYMKGGLEIIHAYAQLQKKYPALQLTIVTPLKTVHPSHLEYIRSIQGVSTLDAKFTSEEMENLYTTHDIFLLPTYRDSFGLVLIEAISYGMPIICTNQFATTEVAINEYNAFVYPNHPLKDYDPETIQMFGKYKNPKTFYTDLFALQQSGALQPIEAFLFSSIERFIITPNLLETFSKNSLELYNTTFHQDIISEKIEAVFS